MMMLIMLGGDDYDDDAAPKSGRVQLYGTASLSTFHFPSRSALLFLSFPFPPLSSAPQPPKSCVHRLRGNGMDERSQ